MNKCLMLLMMGCAALHSFAISSANSYVRISTDCPDVLAIRPVDRDFHLLVTNVAARVHVEIEAIDPWGLVRPGSGSCDVTLAVLGSYEVEDLEPDEDGNYEPNKDGRIIMFKPTFLVSPAFPSGVYEVEEDDSGNEVNRVLQETVGDLTDNHTAWVNIDLIGGINSLKGHVARMPTYPEMRMRSMLHHPSVNPNSVAVYVNESLNKWPTTKIYWYGLSDAANGCCYWSKFNYVFELHVDGVLCDVHKYNVVWPRETPSFSEVVCVGISTYELAEPCGGGRFRSHLKLADFGRTANVGGQPSSCQYTREMDKEENYHKDQDLCVVPVEKCGEGDLFTARGIFYCATNFCANGGQFNVNANTTVEISGDDIYVYADDELTAELDANEILTCFEAEENRLSRSLRKSRLLLKEFWAKNHAGYNAAWKYHCTYGKGSETEPAYERHPAFISQD